MNTIPLRIQGPQGLLEGILDLPQDTNDKNPVAAPLSPHAIAVICHPHPLFGGTMRNKVVHIIARTLVQCGCAVLRFNFRGTEQSEGVFDAGEGEQEDLNTVIQWLCQQYPAKDLYLAGVSFGAKVVIKLMLKAPPKSIMSCFLLATPIGEVLCPSPSFECKIIHAQHDELFAVESVLKWAEKESKTVEVVTGCPHLFDKKLHIISKIIQTNFLTYSKSKINNCTI